MKAFNKDIWRSINRNRKIFISIMIITILGVVMLTGLKASCVDLRQSADKFYNDNGLFDISVISTLGLTENDVEELQKAADIEKAEGAYSETVYAKSDNKKKSTQINTISTSGINEPYVLEGTMPSNADEVAVSRKYINESGKKVGDTVDIEEEFNTETEKANFPNTTFTITAVIIDVMDVNNAEGTASYRASSTTDYTFFVTEEAVESDIYTAVYLKVKDVDSLLCYTDEYEERIAKVVKEIEDKVMPDRESVRDEQVYGASLQYIDEDDLCKWYIRDRSSLSGYNNVESDAGSIEAIGNVFPVLFFIVAILISLTTITRMVEEERGLIGTYKAMGFTNREIRRKYFIYAVSASVTGGIIGNLIGFIAFPQIVFIIFRTMYDLPMLSMTFIPLQGIGGALLFILGITGATAIASRAELIHVPATLMRPKSPRAGQTVFLEYWTWLWKKISFLNKVTARNIFRYKKRMFMTIIGIMGCTALVLCGFAIKDSVEGWMPLQYEHIYQYDLMAVASSADNDKLLSYVDDDDSVENYLNVFIETVKIKNQSGDEESIQVIVVPDNESLDSFINLENINGGILDIKDISDGVLVTRNAAQMLDFVEGDNIIIQNIDLKQSEAKVSAVVENYLGNMMYMTQVEYEKLFGEYSPNGILLNFNNKCSDQSAFVDEFAGKDGVISCVGTETLKEGFSSAFILINMVVYIIIIMAAGLAFVVLFTLSTTNISERIRELSTIKVLGFYDNEVHLYVDKETLILTGIGVILGLPAGAALGHALTYVLQMPSIYFAVSIKPISFVISAAISFVFALIVDFITDRVLDRLDPVEALKSIE